MTSVVQLLTSSTQYIIISKMAQKFVIIAIACIAGMVSADTTYQAYPTYLYPREHRTDFRAIKPLADLQLPLNAYEFHIVPSTAVAELDPTDLSIWDYIPSPMSALSCVASKALSVAKWTITKVPLVILGMAIVIGFCALTPYCTLIIETPFTRHFRSLNIPYLDDVEHFVKEAYHKYNALQY